MMPNPSAERTVYKLSCSKIKGVPSALAKNLANFDDLDFRVYTGQQWQDLHKSHTKDVVLLDLGIDIGNLSEAELIDLNNRIVDCLRFLSQTRAHTRMLDFRIGDRVFFEPEGRPAVSGMVTRHNKKTVTS